MQVTPFLAPLLLAALISVGVAVYALRHRSVAGAASLALVMLITTLWSVGYILELGGIDLQTKVFWSNLTFVTRVSVPLAFLLFSFEYAGLRQWLSWRRLVWFYLLPVFSLLLVWTSEWHPWFWTSRQVQNHGSYSTLWMGFGVGFYLYIIYSISIILVATWLVSRRHIAQLSLYKVQKITVVISMLLPWIANLWHILRLPPVQAVDPTPFAFALSGLGLAWGLFGFRLPDLSPLERKKIFEAIEDGFLVLDAQNRLVDFNPAVQKIFSQPLSSMIGRPIVDLLSAWPALQKLINEPDPSASWLLSSAALARSYDVHISPLYDSETQLAGRVIYLHDVTRLKQAETSLQQDKVFQVAFSQVVDASARIDDLESLAGTVLDLILRVLELKIGVIWLPGRTERMIKRGLAEEMMPALRRLDSLFVQNEQQVIRIEDWPAIEPGVEPLGIRSLLMVPFILDKGQSGRLAVMSASPRSWSEEDGFWLANCTRQLSQTAQRLSAQERAQHHAELLNRLVKQADNLALNQGEDKLLAAIVLGAQVLIDATRVEVILMREEDGFMAGDSLSVKRAVSSDGVRQPKPVLVPDVHALAVGLENPQSLDYQAMGDWPLAYQGQTLAVLRCYYDRPHFWSDCEQYVMLVFTRQAALALFNSRLNDAEKRQRILAETLQDLAVKLSGTLTFEDGIRNVFQSLEGLLAYDQACALTVYGDHLSPLLARGFAPGQIEALTTRLQIVPLYDLPGINQMLLDHQPLVCSQAAENGNCLEFWQISGVNSCLVAPILRQGELVAVLALFSHQPHSYRSVHAKYLKAVSDQASIAVQNAFLYASLQQQAAENTALYRSLSQLFNPGSDVRAVAEQINQAALNEFTNAYCSVLLLDDAETVLRLVASAGYPMDVEADLPLDGPGLIVAAFHSGQVQYTPDVTRDQRYLKGTPLTRSELVLPLRVRDKVIGILNIERQEADAFDERSRRILGAFAEHAALALENALLQKTTHQRLRQLNLLNEITRAALADVDFETLLQKLADRMRELFNADECSIRLWDDELQQIIPGAASPSMRLAGGIALVDENQPDLLQQVLNQGRLLVLEHLTNTQALKLKLGRGQGAVNSLLGLPLIANQVKYGAVSLSYHQTHRFSTQEIALAEQAAGQLALVIAKTRSLQLSQKRALEAENLRQATGALAAAEDLDSVLHSLLDHLASVISFDSASVFLIEKDLLRMVSVKGPPTMLEFANQVFPIRNELFDEIHRSQRPLILEDVKADSRFAGWGDSSAIRGWMGIPLTSQGQHLGFLTVDSHQVNAFHREQAELAQAFANQAAVAIEKARLFREVQELAITDPLTGLYNRRGYTEIGRREMERARRYHHPLAAIMLDIDHFKQINDLYKHSTGDQVLCELAQRCRQRLRENDILGRYGGEEIVLLLPETELEGALSLAEDLRGRVADYPFETNAGALTITISLGVAVFRGGEMGLETLLDRADDAMYTAKQSGRNRVCAEQLPDKDKISG